jgi:hypothetical protein
MNELSLVGSSEGLTVEDLHSRYRDTTTRHGWNIALRVGLGIVAVLVLALIAFRLRLYWTRRNEQDGHIVWQRVLCPCLPMLVECRNFCSRIELRSRSPSPDPSTRSRSRPPSPSDDRPVADEPIALSRRSSRLFHDDQYSSPAPGTSRANVAGPSRVTFRRTTSTKGGGSLVDYDVSELLPLATAVATSTASALGIGPTSQTVRPPRPTAAARHEPSHQREDPPDPDEETEAP